MVWVRIEWDLINKSGDNSGSFVSRGVLWIMSNKFSANVRQTPPTRFIDRPVMKVPEPVTVNFPHKPHRSRFDLLFPEIYLLLKGQAEEIPGNWRRLIGGRRVRREKPKNPQR